MCALVWEEQAGRGPRLWVSTHSFSPEWMEAECSKESKNLFYFRCRCPSKMMDPGKLLFPEAGWQLGVGFAGCSLLRPGQPWVKVGRARDGDGSSVTRWV